MNDFQGLASTTLIGSMPHGDRRRAVELILRAVPEIPVWPQLPQYPAEQMMVQYNEGLPGLTNEGGRSFVRMNSDDFEQQVYSFYEDYLALAEAPSGIGKSRFALGEESGATFRLFLDLLGSASKPFRAIKGQVVGPFTLLSGLKDQNGRALIFDEQFQDIIPKLLALKAKWQIEKLRAYGVPVIIFVDEPALAGFGSSAFITISAELVRTLLSEVVEAVHSVGGLAGIHVCANTDWLLAFESGFDILNFDAHTYFDKFLIYREPCGKFLLNGGNLAWGIVPTDEEALSAESLDSLASKFQDQVRRLSTPEATEEFILSRSLLTPSCGCGSLSEGSAEKVLQLVSDLGRRFSVK